MKDCVDRIDALERDEMDAETYLEFEADMRASLIEMITHLLETETFRHDVTYAAGLDPSD